MNDGIVKEKTSISSTMELYGCNVEDLPISREDRIAMHEVQADRAKQIAEKLYDRISTLRSRLIKVHEAHNWNRLMADDLKKGR